ncbi:MAG: hypothetical protein KC636_02850 [Myxococcales bacterium]|nr:hypothetical protein [Myxococcales bacterium]
MLGRSYRGVALLVLAVAAPLACARTPPVAPVAAADELGSLRAEIARLRGPSYAPPGPPVLQSCRTNDELVCLVREDERSLPASPRRATSDDLALERAYQRFLEHPAAASAPERDAYRYHLAVLLADRDADPAAIAALERLLADDVGSERGVWAALLLLDVLTRRAIADPGIEAVGALIDGLERVRAAPLWDHPSAAAVLHPLHERLDASARWRWAAAQLDEGTTRLARGDARGASTSFSACAETLIAVFNDHAEHSHPDALLWSAARCFDAAGRIGRAIAARAQLLERFQTSEYARLALRDQGGSYEQLAMYEEAAQRYESYAERYPKELEASELLTRAALFRRALGHEARARRDLEQLIRVFGGKDPARAALQFWALDAAPSRDDERLAHLRAYLQTYGRRGPAALEIAAYAELGAIGWRTACAGPATIELCAAIQASDWYAMVPDGARELAYTPIALRVGDRGEAGVTARAELRRVAALAQRRRDIGSEHQPLYLDAVIRAHRLETDAALEALIARIEEGGARSIGRRDAPPRDVVDPQRPARHPLGSALASDAGLTGAFADAVAAIDDRYAELIKLPGGALAQARRGLLREWLLGQQLSAARRRGAPIDRARARALLEQATALYEACLRPGAPELSHAPAADFCSERLEVLAPWSPLVQRELPFTPRCRACGGPAPSVAGIVEAPDKP